MYDAFGKLDIDCYKSGDGGAGKCSTENVKQGVRKGQHDFDATRENQKKKTTQHARIASSLTGTASKKDTPRARQKLQNALFFLWRQLRRRDGRFPKI